MNQEELCEICKACIHRDVCPKTQSAKNFVTNQTFNIDDWFYVVVQCKHFYSRAAAI